MPGSRPIGRHRLAAPGPPGRPADLQLDVADLRVPVEPDVVDARPAGTLDLGPAVQLTDVSRERAAGVLRLPIDHRARHDRLGDGHRRTRGGRCGCLRRVLRGESPAEEDGRRGDQSDALHDCSPSEGVSCTARRRRCSSHVPSVAAIRVPAAAPPNWKRIW